VTYNIDTGQKEIVRRGTYVIQNENRGRGIHGPSEGDTGLLTAAVGPEKSASDFLDVE
jgi:hypothetical protein